MTTATVVADGRGPYLAAFGERWRRPNGGPTELTRSVEVRLLDDTAVTEGGGDGAVVEARAGEVVEWWVRDDPCPIINGGLPCSKQRGHLDRGEPCESLAPDAVEVIDYRSVLRRYIQHVGEVEGSTFMSQLNSSMTDAKFTEAEVAVLEQLDLESRS